MVQLNPQRVVIVTGAGSGLGKTHAKLLATLGSNVVVNDISRDEHGRPNADNTVAEIRALGGRAIANHDSISSWSGAHNLVKTAVDQFGRIDAVVNNAGVLRDKTFINLSQEEIELVISVNLLGSIFVSKAAWSQMIAQKHGRIVLTSSASGLADAYGQANYGAAKAGLVGLMNSLKNEGRKHGVLVNTICPLANTPMTENLLPDDIANLSKPEHVSALVGWLCSAACDVTGRIFVAGAGHYAEARMLKSRGVVLDPHNPATIEQISENMSRIQDFSDPIPYTGVMDSDTKKAMGLV